MFTNTERVLHWTRLVASVQPPYALLVTPETCPSRHLFHAMLSENTVVTAREYYNNDATQINETGTLPSDISTKLLTMQAASPVAPQNMYRSPRKKHRNVINLARSKSMDKDKRDKKKANAKRKLRARSLSIEIKNLTLALNADGDDILPSEIANTQNIFDNVDSEITSTDMMKIFTPRRKKSSAKGLVQDELELDLSLTLQSS